MTDQLYLPDLGQRYQNPVLFCDYSDPDAIRVGDTYYLTASSFNYVPGLPILTSKDLVNWQLVNYAIRTIPAPGYDKPRHADGVWAPAIRWHDGWFYIFYGMPDEGIYMVRTQDALAAWEAPVLVLPGKGLIDPCPFWDDDGRAWVVHGYAKSRIGFKSWLGIFPISPDGSKALGDDHLLFDGTKEHPTIEGPKVYKRDGWYYIFAPAGGVATGWQTVLRSRSLFGPYEDRLVLRQGASLTNGPHQGAWVEAQDGSDWFLHFQSRGLYGRIVHLQPMTWQNDDWPVIGLPESEHADCGNPVDAWQKPAGEVQEALSLQASDDFSGQLGLQWQFMGNPQPGSYELMNGMLRLYALGQPDGSGKLWHDPHTLTQKIVCRAFRASVSLDASELCEGEQAGLGLVGGQYAYAALRRTADGVKLVYVQSEGAAHEEQVLAQLDPHSDKLTLSMTLTPTAYDAAETIFAYDDGQGAQPIGLPFSPARHTWVGARLALFAMPTDGYAHGGSAVFGPFRVEPVQA